MDEFKQRHFAESHPGAARIFIEPLPGSAVKEIRATLQKRLIHVEAGNEFSLVNQIRARAVPLRGVNAGDDGFQLEQVFWRLQLHPRDVVFVNWGRFESIDSISFAELTRYFNDIWYPSSDDIEIFDSTFHWIVSISHSGDVLLTKL